jgi:hypothetical protein
MVMLSFEKWAIHIEQLLKSDSYDIPSIPRLPTPEPFHLKLSKKVQVWEKHRSLF